MESDLEIWEMAKIIGKWLRYMGHSLSIWESAWLSWKCPKNLTKNVGNDVYIWELTKVFEKRPKYLGNDVDLWEMAQRCGEMT